MRTRSWIAVTFCCLGAGAALGYQFGARRIAVIEDGPVPHALAVVPQPAAARTVRPVAAEAQVQDAPESIAAVGHKARLEYEVARLTHELDARDRTIVELREQAGATNREAPGATEERGGDRAPNADSPPARETPEQIRAQALALFYQYFDDAMQAGSRERRVQARELIRSLREMGEPAVQALIEIADGAGSTGERAAAARMLGSLNDPQATPILRRILETETDPLLRRGAARGLSRMGTEDALPVLAAVLARPAEDSFVRLSAAYGLARAGEPLGYSTLEQLYADPNGDGRVASMAFRTVASLDSAESVPFMRDVAGSGADVSYRIRAIEFLGAHYDPHARAVLSAIINTPGTPSSVRDAAQRALAVVP